MGREGPAHLGSRRQGHLVALTLSLLLTCGPGPTASTLGKNTENKERKNSTFWDTTNSTSLSTTKTLTSAEQGSLAKLKRTSVAVGRTTSSGTFPSDKTNDRQANTEKETKGMLRASVASADTSKSGREYNAFITSIPSSDLSTDDNREQRYLQVSPLHRSRHITSERPSLGTDAPESAGLSRTPGSSIPADETWESTGTSQTFTGPQPTEWTETRLKMETLTSEASFVDTSPDRRMDSASTEPWTSFPDTTSLREPSSNTLTQDVTAGPTTEELLLPTDTSVTGGSSTSITQDTTPRPLGTTASSETAATDVTLSVSRATVSVSTAVTKVAPGSSAPGGTNPPSSTIPPKMPETFSTGNPESREGTSQVLTPSNPGHHFSSPGTSPAGDLVMTTSLPLSLSTSAPGATASRFSASSDHEVTSSRDTGTPESAAKTDPSSSLLRSGSRAETSAERVRNTTSPLAWTSPSEEGTTRSVFTLSTSPDATDRPSISTGSTLASEPSAGPGPLSITSDPGVKTTSPSSSSISEENNTPLSMTGRPPRGPWSASVSPSEASDSGTENNSMTTSGPSSGVGTAESRTGATRVSPSHPERELGSPHTASERPSLGTDAPESAGLSRTPGSSIPADETWESTGTSQTFTGPQPTEWTETRLKMETLTSEASFVDTSPDRRMDSASTEPWTSFPDTTSLREPSSNTLTQDVTAGPTTEELLLPTDTSVTGGSSTSITQDTTPRPLGTTASSETAATDVTLSVSRATVSVSTAVTKVAPGSSAPGGTNPPSSTIPPKMPETFSTGNPESREGTSQVLTPSNPGHHFSSPGTSPAGDLVMTTSLPLSLSTSAPGATASRFSASSDHEVTSSRDTGTPESAAKTDPSSSLLRSGSRAETSAERVRNTTSPLAWTSPSEEGTTRSVFTLSTSPDATDRPSISTGSTLASEPSAGPGPLSITSDPGVKTTSPSSSSISEENNTPLSMTGRPPRGPWSASVSPSEASDSGTENNSMTTSGPSSGVGTAESRTGATRVSPSHPERELGSPHTASERPSLGTDAPESAGLSRTPGSSIPADETWESTGTSQTFTGPQPTEWTETRLKMETLTSEASFVDTSPDRRMDSASTEPWTSFPDTTSLREPSSNTLTQDVTAGPTTEELLLPTDTSVTGGSSTSITQDTTPRPLGTTASSETAATDVTLSVSRATVSVSTAVTKVAPGSSAPGGTNPPSSTIPPKMPETFSTGNPESREGTSQVLTPSNPGHHFSSPGTSPAGDLVMTTSLPLSLSTSAPGATASRFSASSDHEVTSSRDTGTPESAAKTDPSSSLLRSGSRAETSAERVRNTTSPLAWTSPSEEGTTRSVFTLSTSPDATDRPSISTGSTLASEPSAGPGPLSITSDPGVKTTSPSSSSISEENNTPLSMTGRPPRGPWSASVSPSEASDSGTENNSMTTSGPSSGVGTAESRTGATRVSPSHPERELGSPHTASERPSLGTDAPESAGLSRTPGSSIPADETWESTGTSQTFTGPQPTEWTETRLKMETLTSEASFVDTSPDRRMDSASTEPWTSFPDTTSLREPSSNTLTQDVTAGPTTEELLLPTDTSVTGGSSTSITQDTTPRPLGTTASSETAATDVTLSVSRATVSVSTAVTKVAPGSSAPGGTNPPSSTIPPKMPETFSTGNPESREGTSQVLTPSNPGHHFSSPGTSPAGDLVMTTSLPLSLSTSAPGATASRFSASSDHEVTSSRDTGTPESAAKTDPSSSLLRSGSRAETSAERVRNTTSPLAWTSPSEEGTTRSVFTLSTSPDATDRPSISTGSTLASEPSAGPGPLSITSDPGVKTTSPSSSSISEENNTPLSMTGRPPRGPWSASVSPSEASDSGTENNSMTTSGPSSGVGTAESRTGATRVSPSHPERELGSPHTASERPSLGTDAPESAGLSRTPGSSIPADETWESTGTSQTFTGPQPTEWTETRLKMETLTSEASFVDTSPDRRMDSASTEPWTSFPDTTSLREPSSNTLTQDVTAGPTTEELLLPTDTSVTGGSSTSITQDTTPRPLGTTASSETAATDVTLSVSRATVSVSTAVTKVAPGSSAPGGTNPPSSTIPPKMPETFSTGNPESREGTSQVLTPSNPGHHFSSPGTSPAGDLVMTTSLPLSLSTSAPGATASRFSASSDHEVTSSRDTGTPESAAKTDPSSSLLRSGSRAETSAERVRNTTSPLAWTSPSEEGTTRSVFTLSTSPDATDRPSISTGSTLASEPSAGPGPLSITSDPGVKTTSPSSSSISEENNTPLSMTGRPPRGPWSASVSPSEASDSGTENNSMTTSGPSSGVGTAESRTGATRVSPSHPERELGSPHTASERPSLGTDAPESAGLSRTPGSSIPADETWESTGTSQTFTGPQPTEWTETRLKMETLTSEASFVDTSPDRRMDSASTEPWTSFPDTTSLREPSSNTLTQDVTAGPTTEELLLPTDTSVTGGSSTSITQDTTPRPLGTTASSETAATDVTLSVSRATVSVSTAVTKVAPGSSAPGGTNPPSSTIPPKMPETFSTGNPESREGTSQVLTPSNPGHHFSSPGTSPAGDLVMTTSLPLSLSTSAPGATASRFSASSDHEVTSSRDTGTPESAAKTDPSSSLLRSGSRAETSAERVRNTTSPLAWTSPSEEGTTRSVFTLSTSPDATDRPSISTGSTLASEPSAGPGPLSITSDPGVKTTSPSSSSISEENNTPLSMTGRPPRGPWSASVSPSEASDSGTENNSMTTSGPSSGVGTAESRTGATRVSPSHPERELGSPHTASERPSLGTDAPESAGLSRTPGSSIPADETWESTGTSQTFTGPQPTEWTETRLKMETLTSEASFVDTSPDRRMDSASTEPWTSFPDTTSLREPSSNTLTQDVTAGPTTEELLLPTDTSVTGGSSTSITQDTTPRPLGTTASSETAATDVTLSVSRATVSVSTAVTKVAPGSSAPGGTNPPSSTIPPKMPETFSTGNPESREGTSQVLTPSNPGHHFSSPGTSPAGDLVMTTSLPLSLSTSAPGATASRFSASSDHEVTSSRDTGTPESAAKTDPSSSLLRSGSRAETSAERVRNTTSPLAWTSPSEEGTTRSVFTLSTSPDATDRPSISTGSTLASEPSAGPGPLSITSDPGVKTTSPSSSSISEENNTPLSMTGRPPRGPWSASVSPSEASDSGTENNSMTTSGPSSGVGTAESRTGATRVSPSHPERELGSPHTASERPSLGTDAPESAGLSRTPGSSIPADETWESTGTSQTFTGPQPTEWTETRLKMETLTSEASFVDTSPDRRMDSASTEPWTSFPDTTSLREPSSNTLTQDVTAGPTTEELLLPTDTSVTGGSSTSITQDTTPRPLGTTASSETAATDVTLSVSRATVSVSTAVTKVAPGSSAPGGTNPPSSTIPPKMPETFSTGNPESREGTSQVLTPSNPGHHFSSPGTSPAGDLVMTTSLPLSLSTSAPGATASRFSASSDHEVTSSRDTGTPESAAKTDPSSALH
ncbi:mucin-16-like, partial [Phacochoerus africanus]|uniref:mucin-16-like n=1 Tax=Phacochoerus africanus TaxID=41426 RepID=UPI001FD8DACF